MASEPRLRIEVFPEDLDRFVDFYVNVLRFEVADDRRGGAHPYVSVRRGAIRIGATPAWQEVNRDLRSVPTGIELVIEVDDLIAERNAIIASGHSLAEDLTERPWGLSDFRLFDPDGYYLRFTTLEPRR
jgi:lactoylglutathione lyase